MWFTLREQAISSERVVAQPQQCRRSRHACRGENNRTLAPPPPWPQAASQWKDPSGADNPLGRKTRLCVSLRSRYAAFSADEKSSSLSENTKCGKNPILQIPVGSRLPESDPQYSMKASLRGRALSESNTGALPHCFRKRFSFLMEDSVVNVWPKLLKEVRSSVDRYTRQPKLIGVGEGALLGGVIKMRDPRQRLRRRPRSIEGFMAIIFSCDDCT